MTFEYVQGGDSKTSIGTLLPVFQFVSIAFLSLGTTEKNLVPSSLCLPLHMFVYINEIPFELSLLPTQRSLFSQPFLTRRILLPFHYLLDLSLDSESNGTRHIVWYITRVYSWVIPKAAPCNKTKCLICTHTEWRVIFPGSKSHGTILSSTPAFLISSFLSLKRNEFPCVMSCPGTLETCHILIRNTRDS